MSIKIDLSRVAASRGDFVTETRKVLIQKKQRERKLEKDIKTGKESGVLMHTCNSSTGVRGGKTAV